MTDPDVDVVTFLVVCQQILQTVHDRLPPRGVRRVGGIERGRSQERYDLDMVARALGALEVVLTGGTPEPALTVGLTRCRQWLEENPADPQGGHRR